MRRTIISHFLFYPETRAMAKRLHPDLAKRARVIAALMMLHAAGV